MAQEPNWEYLTAEYTAQGVSREPAADSPAQSGGYIPLRDFLTTAGQEGWELVTITSTRHIVLKRRAAPSDPSP